MVSTIFNRDTSKVQVRRYLQGNKGRIVAIYSLNIIWYSMELWISGFFIEDIFNKSTHNIADYEHLQCCLTSSYPHFGDKLAKIASIDVELWNLPPKTECRRCIFALNIMWYSM